MGSCCEFILDALSDFRCGKGEFELRSCFLDLFGVLVFGNCDVRLGGVCCSHLSPGFGGDVGFNCFEPFIKVFEARKFLFHVKEALSCDRGCCIFVALCCLCVALGACIVDECLCGECGFLKECLDVVLGFDVPTFYSELGCFDSHLFEYFHKAGKSLIVRLFSFVIVDVHDLWGFRDGCSEFANSGNSFLG